MKRQYFIKWGFIFIVELTTLILGLRTSINFFYFLFWLQLVTVLVSVLWVLLEYHTLSLDIKRLSVNKMEEEDVFEVETVVRNKGVMPVFNLVIEDRIVSPLQKESRSQFIEFLRPSADIHLRYVYDGLKRGRYIAGPFKVFFFDPFGLVCFSRSYKSESEFFVYPKTFPIRHFPQLMKGSAPWYGIESARVSGDDDEFYGTREFKEGDTIKRVHWISTARKNKLIVKQYQRQTFFRATIMFNLEQDKNFGKGKDSIAEYTIKIAASIARFLLSQNISVSLIAHTGEMVFMPFNRGPEYLEDVMKFLAVAEAQSKVGLAEVYEEFAPHIPNESSLVVIMLDKDWQSMPLMLSMDKRNVSIVPFIILSSSFLMDYQTTEIVQDIHVKFSQTFHLTPVIFSYGDNLEEVFQRYVHGYGK